MAFRRAFVVGLLLSMFATAPMLHGGAKKGTQYAILVSVSKYAKSDQWRPLKYTIDEMDEFRTVLTKTGFAADNVVFLHDRQTDEKLRPTSANIFKKLDLLLQEIGPDDTLLIALNGHGVQFGGDMTGYFAPVNADLNDKKTLVAMDGKDGLYGRLEQCKARKKLLIVNACRNDPTIDFAFAAKKYDLVDKEDRDPPKGTAALFSCKPGQKSYEYPPDQNRKRSFFYHHLIEAWQGNYSDGEKVSLDHVFDQVVRKTAADARNIFSESQTPWPRRKYDGEWMLTKLPPLPPNPESGTEFTGHAGLVLCVAISPDNKTLATGSVDMTARLWDFAAAKELKILRGHSDTVNCITFNNDGSLIATGSSDKSIRLYSKDGIFIKQLQGHTGGVMGAAFSPDGQYLASAGSDKTVRLWNSKTGETIKMFLGHERSVYSVAFNRAGSMIASTGDDGIIKIWDVKDLRNIKSLMLNMDIPKGKLRDAFSVVAFTPDDKQVLSVGQDKYLHYWSIADGKEAKRLGPTKDWLFGMAVSPDGKKVLTAGYGGSLRVYNIATGEMIFDDQKRNLDRKQQITYSAIFSPDGEAIITCQHDLKSNKGFAKLTTIGK